jgi:plastocyanin
VVPAFALALDNAAPSVNLAATSVVNVTITPQSWSGAVALTVTGLPSDVTAAFDNASINVEGSAPVTAKLTLTSLSSTAPAATPFNIVGTVGTVVKTSPATVTVKPWIDIHLPVNADSVTDSFGTVNITAPADIANNPVTVNFINDDSTPHEIHAENQNQGFPHGQGTFGQGQADSPVRQVTQAGTYQWHLHDDAPPGGPPGGTVVIQ